MNKARHTAITPGQLRAMQSIASALLTLAETAGAEAVVVLVDWGGAATVGAGVARGVDQGVALTRLVREAPEHVASWSRRLRAGQGQLVVGEKVS